VWSSGLKPEDTFWAPVVDRRRLLIVIQVTVATLVASFGLMAGHATGCAARGNLRGRR
jgi:hypothetical protein